MKPTFYDHSAEKALIGHCFEDPGKIDEVLPHVDDVDFHLERHRRIFGRIVAMRQEGLEVSPGNVQASFDREGEGAATGGIATLSLMLDETTIRGHIAAATTIRERARARSMDAALKEGLGSLSEGASVEEVKALIEGAGGVTDAERGVIWADELAALAFKSIEAGAEGGEDGFISTGFPGLDRALGGGGRGGYLTIVAGRPSMGKSVFAGNICMNYAERVKEAGGDSAALFNSYEMSADVLGTRWIQAYARVSPQQATSDTADAAEAWSKLVAGAESLHALGERLGVYAAGAQTIEACWAKVRELKRKHGVKVVVLDYLQLMSESAQFKGDNVGNVGHIAKTAKKMAKAEDVWVILLSQLNRKCEDREDKRPRKADLRASGEIEEAADQIIALYRPVYYAVEAFNAKRPPQQRPIGEDDPAFDNLRTRAEALVLKNRNGDGLNNTVPLDFHKHQQRFTDPSTGAGAW